ncbi:MAG TPA: carboxypeptidase-like regulatory domain-containing protein [Flavisolibacter sp.]|nr:carboxypeptidase-like regulatory domain-containing protein [Flavisolibacter sp.]
MKRIRMALPAFAIAFALLAFTSSPATSIKGKVTPAGYAVRAWAMSESDTLYTTIENGNFEFANAKPGVYRIVVEALSPYRHLAKDGVVVNEGQATDVELSLQRWESSFEKAK